MSDKEEIKRQHFNNNLIRKHTQNQNMTKSLLLDQGQTCNFESSRAKVVCSEAEWRVVDRCAQMLGGQGVTGETEVMRIFMDMRSFRIYDGPSEVHRWSMARKIIKAATPQVPK